MIRIVIPVRLPGMNEYTKMMRTNAYAGASFKKKWQEKVEFFLTGHREDFKDIKLPIVLNYEYYEANKRRDHDNVSGFAHKIIQDAMVEVGLIPNDGWNEISGYTDTFYVDRDFPRIEVWIDG